MWQFPDSLTLRIVPIFRLNESSKLHFRGNIYRYISNNIDEAIGWYMIQPTRSNWGLLGTWGFMPLGISYPKPDISLHFPKASFHLLRHDPDLYNIWRVPWGYPNSWMGDTRKSQSKMDTLGVQRDLGNLRDSLLDVVIRRVFLYHSHGCVSGSAKPVGLMPVASVWALRLQSVRTFHRSHGNPQVPWKKNITPLFVGVVNTQHFHLNFIYKYMNPTSHWYPLIFHWPSFLALDNTEFSQVQTWGAKTGLPSMDAALA